MMDEITNTFNLSPEQHNTAALIRRLLGKRIADRYVDFCHLAAGTFPLRVSSPVAAHALRELESIVRQTLKVPMDVAILPSQNDIERIEKATVSLRELGYGDDEVQRVSRQLQPSLTHKQEIEKIVVRLGLAPDGDVARAWKSISQAHREAHGGRALHQSFVVDDAFRAEWQVPFDTVIRGLMIALQGKYAAFIHRIDQLVATQDRSNAVTAFSKEIPGALPLLGHFFSRLETPDWLPHLVERNLLLAPLSVADEVGGDGLQLRQWPAGQYLQRMAKSVDASARSLVVDSLRNIASSTHPDVKQIGMEILSALPPSEAAQLVDIAEGWLTPETQFLIAQGPHDLIKGFAKEGEQEAALRMTRALFKVFPNNGELSTIFGRHMYEHFLPTAIKALAPVCKADAVGLLCELLDQAVRIGPWVCEYPPHDYSYHLSRTISEQGTKHSVTDALVGEIVRASKISIATDSSSMREVVSSIRSHPSKIFARIALHVLALKPSEVPDLAEESLTNRHLLGETWCRAEYGELARAWFPSLPAERQTQILADVDSLPDLYRDQWKKRFHQNKNRPPNADEEREYDASFIQNILWDWRDILPAERRDTIEARGDPDARFRLMQEPDKSPLEGSDFATRPLEKIIEFLETWQPSTGEIRETITAIGQELCDAAASNPARFSAGAFLFTQLAPIYVRRVLEGLSNAVRNNREVDWAGILSLIETVANPTWKASSSGIEGDDPDWSWARKAAVGVLADGLRRGRDGIPFDNAKLVQDLVLALYRSAPRRPDTESFEEDYRSFPYFGAQSTWRGAAIELCVMLIFWLSKDPMSEVGTTPRNALDKLPEIQAIFELELADKSSDGRIPRAIIGRYINWLDFFAKPWLHGHVSTLFPSDDRMLRDATWYAHLTKDSGPNLDLAQSMRDCYVTEIGRLGVVEAGDDLMYVEERLAEYLVILYILEAFPDDVFELFWDSAPAHVRQHAVWFLGSQLELPDEEIPEERRLRAHLYWDRRLADAKGSTDPDRFRQELSAIGQFFYRNGINSEWLMDQILAMSEAGFAPGDSYSVIDGLAKVSPEFPDRVAQVVASLIKNQHIDQLAFRTQTAALRAIFVNGLAIRSPATTSAIAEAINYLSTLGETSCLDLLPH